MARRRLNKKVALIGSTVFLLLALAAVVVILRLSRDPAQFIADGDVAWAAKDYESARRNYARAFGLTKSSRDKIDLLFKLADVFRETEQWRKVLACWEQIITSDPYNLKARMGRLKYCTILADSLGSVGHSAGSYWQEALAQTNELLEIVERDGLLAEAKADWEPSFGPAEEPQWAGGVTSLGPCLYLVKGRATYEMARLGGVTSPDELLDDAQNSLHRARELDPNVPDVHYYLAQVIVQRGENAASRGALEERDAARRQAGEILAKGVEATGDAPQAHIYQITHKFAAARTGGITAARARMQALQGEYQALRERFPTNPKVFAAVAEFYALYSAYAGSQTSVEALDRAIEAAETACRLDAGSVLYARFAARLYYRKFSLYGNETALQQGTTLAERGLELPDAQDTPGPRQYAKQANRLSLCAFLTRCYVERILMLDRSAPQRSEMLAKAEQAVREIEQIRGSGENPHVVMWQGMLDLAKGDTSGAIRNLYASYEQIRVSAPADGTDPFLPYTLAKIFEGTTEIGAVAEFLEAALSAGIVDSKPAALLDYADVLRQARSYDAALNALDVYDERFGATVRSKTLRAETLIVKGHLTEAQEVIVALNPDDPNTLWVNVSLVRAESSQLRRALRQEESADESPIALQPLGDGGDPGDAAQSIQAMTTKIRQCWQREAGLVRRLLQKAPDMVEERQITRLCEALIAHGDIATANDLVAAFLAHSPNSLEALSYRGLLSEPDPSNCSESRRTEIRQQAIGRLADPIRRSLELGLFYQQQKQYDSAVSQWRSVLKATTSQGEQTQPAYLHARQLGPRHAAAGYLFDLARQQADWPLAEEVAGLAREDSLDDCGGSLFAARLAFAKGERADALAHLDECLRQRPIFSYGYMLRGNVHAEMGNEPACIKDLKKAASLNPVDPLVARALANALYVRNSKLGSKLSSEQVVEARGALERAIQLDPRDSELLIAYAEMVSESEPLKALALRQAIQISAPSLSNAVILGKLATQIAVKETDAAKRQAFFTMAEAAFEQARQMEPKNQFMLDNYAEYYRATGQNDKAMQLLVQSQDDQLLWRHYFRVGRFDEATRLLQRLYNEQAGKADALKGLILVAEETGDRESVKKYAEELLVLEDNLTNRLAQIRAYLDVGLIQDAQHRLQSFKDKHPGEPRILLMEALLAKRQGQLERAFELTNRNLESNQDSAAAWRLRGEICFLRGDYEQAVADLRKSRVLEDHPVTAVMLAKTYMWSGRDDEATAELRSVLDKPQTPQEARALLESIYRRRGRTGALRQLYADTLKQLPDNVQWLNRAGAFAIDQREYARAEELYGKAYRLKQESFSGRPTTDILRDLSYAAALDGYLRALVLGAGDPTAGDGSWHPEKLDKIFQEGRKYTDTPYAAVAFFRMAEAKKRLGELEAASDYCRKAVSRAWDHERLAVEVLLRVYLLMGEQEVSTYCRQRLQTDPDSLAANFTMFNLATIKDDYDDAVTYIDRCVELTGPETPEHVEYMAKKAQILALAYKKTSDNAYLKKAIDVYESLLVKTPKNSSVLNNLAYMLALSGEKLSEALHYAEKALEQNPDEANYLDTYAYVLHKNGRHGEAVRSLTAALQQYEVDGSAPADVYEHLGLAYEALGERRKALAAYRRALEVGANAMPERVTDRISAAIERLAP